VDQNNILIANEKLKNSAIATQVSNGLAEIVKAQIDAWLKNERSKFKMAS
jgi:hypothetical protein